MNATERAGAMMWVKMSELPPRAIAYAKHLCCRHGMCGEVFMTAYAHYAQVVEELPCDDELYQADNETVAWFKANP